MRKKIIIGSLLTAGILLMIPSVPAVEFNTVFENYKLDFLEKIQDIGSQKLRVKLKNEAKPLLFSFILALILEFMLIITAKITGLMFRSILLLFLVPSFMSRLFLVFWFLILPWFLLFL